MQKGEIEAGLGELEWKGPPGDCRIVHFKTGVNVRDKGVWTDCFGWLKERGERFHSVFGPRIRALVIPSDSQ